MSTPIVPPAGAPNGAPGPTAGAPLRVQVHGLEFEVAAVSEQGPRAENQDAYRIDAFADAGVLAVADGMGGEKGGRLAAETALQAVLASAPLASHDDARRALRAADQAVVRAAQADPGARGGMGCALAVLSLVPSRADGPGWVGASVGDVRVLSRSPDGTVRLETRDHTPAYQRWEAGEIELDEIPETPGANRLQRAIGRGGEADAFYVPARPGWSYLLLSDGVTKAMRLDELGAAMAAPSAATGCELIRHKVEERGPDDNYTAVLVRIGGGPAAARSDATVTQEFMSPRSPHPPVVPAPPRRGAWPAVLLLLSLLALAAAGYAAWTAHAAQRQAAGVVEIDSLRRELDSLRARVQQLETPDTAAGVPFPLSASPGAARPPAGSAGGAAPRTPLRP